MGFFPKRTKKHGEWNLALSPDEQKKRRREAEERRRAIAERSSKRSKGQRSARSAASEREGNGTAGAIARDHTVAFALGVVDGALGLVSPDLWTSNLALRNAKRGLTATVAATAGSVVGGALTYRRSQKIGKRASRAEFLGRPGIGGSTLSRVERESAKHGTRAMVSGLVEDVPYATYARELGLRRVDMTEFLAWSAATRMTRFAAMTGGVAIASGLARSIAPRLTRVAAPVLLNAAWIAHYSYRWNKNG